MWALIQYDWYPYKNGEIWTEACEERQGEDSHLQPKECLRLSEVRKETWNRSDPSLEPSKGAWFHQQLGSECPKPGENDYLPFQANKQKN